MICHVVRSAGRLSTLGVVMALYSCPDCGRQVSDTAPTCPACGLALSRPAAPAGPRRCAVPFVPVTRGERDEAQRAATQLSQMIERWEADGWRFSHLEQITTVRDNGCLASLLGNSTSVVTVQVAILDRAD